jgi:hypothetical protein
MMLDELRALLALLRESGVSAYETPELKLAFHGEAPDPTEWSDFRAQMRKERDEEEEDEERVQFAHVAGGPPPRFTPSNGQPD